MASEWYVLVDESEKGPIPGTKLKQLAVAGKLKPTMQVRQGTEGEWVEAGGVLGLFDTVTRRLAASVPTLGGERFYQPSGAIPILGLVLVPLLGIPVTLLLAGIYGTLEASNPFIYISFLGTLGVGFGIAFTINFVSYMTNVRNRVFTLLNGVAQGGVAVYFSWVFSLWAYSEFQDEYLIWNPVVLVQMIGVLADVGLWSIFGFTPTGWVIYLVWLAEAGIILLLAAAATSGNPNPYCEDCDCWAEQQEDVLVLPAAAAETLADLLVSEQYKVLFEHQDELVDSDDYLTVDLYCCPQCEGSNFLAVRHLETSYDDDGDPDVDDETIVEPLRVPLELVAELLRDESGT